jgi:hypothetical protein
MKNLFYWIRNNIDNFYTRNGFWRKPINQFWNDPECNYSPEGKRYMEDVFLPETSREKFTNLHSNN